MKEKNVFHNLGSSLCSLLHFSSLALWEIEFITTEEWDSCTVSILWTLGEDQLTQDDLRFPPALQRISTFCMYQLEVEMLKNSKGAIIPDFTFSQVNYSVEDNQQLDKCKFLEELSIQEVSGTYLWMCLTFTGLMRKQVDLTCTLEDFYSGN